MAGILCNIVVIVGLTCLRSIKGDAFYACQWFCTYSYGALLGGSSGCQSSANMHTTLLTVQSKVLGKGLSNQQFKSFTNEVAHSPSILIWITSHKTLVSHVYQREQLTPLVNNNNKNCNENYAKLTAFIF